MRQIKEYHARFGVKRGGETLMVTANLTDWMDDFEFLKEAARHIGVRTVGDVVESLVGRKIVIITLDHSIGCNGVRIETIVPYAVSHIDSYDWDMKLV